MFSKDLLYIVSVLLGVIGIGISYLGGMESHGGYLFVGFAIVISIISAYGSRVSGLPEAKK